MTARLKLIRRINFAVAGGISFAYIYGKVKNAENMKQTLEFKVENEPVPVPASIKNLLEEIKSEIKEDKIKKSKYSLFISKGFDITQLGIPEIFGVHFGLPYNFLFDKDKEIDLTVVIGAPSRHNKLFNEYDDKMSGSEPSLNSQDREPLTLGLNTSSSCKSSVAHISKQNIALKTYSYLGMDGNKPLTNPTEIETLKKSMCLSKEAKKFALAHEIYKSHHSPIYSCGILPLIIVGNFNFLSYVLEKWSIKQKKALPLTNHLILFMLGAWFYALFYDVLSVYRDSCSDFLASQLGSSYIRGGLEYYEKMIARNKILKKVQKSSHFTEDGEVQTSSFRTNRMPLVRRITFLKEYEKGNFDPGHSLFITK